VWGTCAGMILLSNQAENIKKGGQELFGGLDIKVKRNAFGHQVDSFTLQLHVAMFETPFLGVFIRAPVIESVGEGIEILARVPEKENVIVACKKNNILVTAFHPELTNDYRFHEYFVSMIK
jgi:5'-phosphate synthase pdxT subunit